MIMIDVTEYKQILSQRDATIVRQADEIAELRSWIASLREDITEFEAEQKLREDAPELY